MQDYFWSARFICAAVSMMLAIALLVGAVLALPYTGSEAWYYVAIGASLCAVAAVLSQAPRIGLAAYVALFSGALAASLAIVGLNIFGLMPRLSALILWGAILFILRHRIAPTHDATGDPSEALRMRYYKARYKLREWS